MLTAQPQPVLISVVIPFYNRSSTILRAINSALNQTMPPFEVLVVDDGSNEKIESVLSTVEDSRVKVIRLESNHGAQYARIAGIQIAVGDFLVFLDSDDELLPDSIENRFMALQNSSWKEALVYGDAIRGAVTDNFTRLNGHVYPFLLKELSLCPYSTMLIPRSCFAITGLPEADFPSWQDDDMVLTIGRHFPVIHCGVSVAKMDTGSVRISGNKRAIIEGLRRMLEKYSPEILAAHGRFRIFCWQLRLIRIKAIAEWDEVFKKLGHKVSIIDLLKIFYLTIVRLFLRGILMPFFRHFYG